VRVPLSWLRDFAPFESPPDELASSLNELGLVVESVERIGGGLEEIVVARVLEIRPIKGADRIRHVTVDAGSEPLDVVCGAWNFAEGDLVPLAPVGATLPGGLTIARRKMKGAVSNGMLCSGAELGLSDDHDGIMVLPSGTEPGVAFTAALGIEADVVFDLDITPNRPDALSIAGVARDLAAACRIPFAIPPVAAQEKGVPAESLTSVVVSSPELCPLFVARVVTDVAVGQSPSLIASRLTLCGMRPINSVVDASNYVMLELGQPTHPYDLDRLPGGGILVRSARAGERLVTLDDTERLLAEGDCLICDADGDPVGVAGIMGGASSEISDSTTRVLVESAHFDSMAIARTAKRLGLRTEASVRFERGADPEAASMAAERVCALIAGGGGSIGAGAVVTGSAPEREALRLRIGRLNALLGTDLDAASVEGYLAPIGFATRSADAGDLLVEVPPWRPDVTAEIDLVEEVARHHGYSRIPRTVPATAQVGGITDYQRDRRLVADIMVGAGLSEVWTPSLLGPGDHELAGLGLAELHLANPMTREESVLRRSLLPGLVRVARHNAGHRNPEVKVFETGVVFDDPPAGQRRPGERELVAALLAGDEAPAAVRLWRTVEDGMRIAGAELAPVQVPGLHPTRTAVIEAAGDVLGVVGEVDPSVLERFEVPGRAGWLELDLGRLSAAARRPAALTEVSVYPSSDIDLAFVVDDRVPAGVVCRTIEEAGGELLVGVWLFDVYRNPADLGESRRSLAFRLRFCAMDRTLTDAEVGEARSACIAAVESSHGATLRA